MYCFRISSAALAAALLVAFAAPVVRADDYPSPVAAPNTPQVEVMCQPLA